MKAKAQTRPGAPQSLRIDVMDADRDRGWNRGGPRRGKAAPVALILCLVMGACTAATGSKVDDSGYLVTLPEDVVALARPNQNLAKVQFNEEDGCYWYLHEGPVEATMLPLRTATGNPICVQRDAG